MEVTPAAPTSKSKQRWTWALASLLEILILGLFLYAICYINFSSELLPKLIKAGAFALSAFGLGVAFFFSFAQKTENAQGQPRRMQEWLTKPLGLGLLLLIALGVLVNWLVYFHNQHPSMQDEIFSLPTDLQAATFVPAIVLLLLSRFFTNHKIFLWIVFLLFGVGTVILFYQVEYPTYREVKEAISKSQFPLLKPRILVPIFPLITLRGLLILCVPFFSALISVWRRFAWWKYFSGWIIGYTCVKLIIFQRLSLGLDFPFICLNFALIALLARLPLQRRALERLTGIALLTQPADSLVQSRSVSPLIKYGAALLLGLLLAIQGIVSRFETEMFRVLNGHITLPHFSPALMNAYDVLKYDFTKGRSSHELFSPQSQRYTDSEAGMMSMVGGMSPQELETVFARLNPTALEQQLTRREPLFSAFEKAARADYWLFYDGQRVVTSDFINLRVASQGLAARAQLRIYQHRDAEALKDIETILKIAALMNTDPAGSLVVHMIGTALRGIALAPTKTFILCRANDPAALKQLCEMLMRNAAGVRRDFPEQIISRTEPGLWPISPFFEITAPGMIRAGTTWYQKWAQFDNLLIAIALELYRNDHGQYPDRLEQLVPDYMDRLPRDPFNGKPYLYKNLGSEFSLQVNGGDQKMQPGYFPHKGMDDQLKKQLSQFKPTPATAASEPVR